MFHVYVTIISYEYQNTKLHVFKLQLADFLKNLQITFSRKIFCRFAVSVSYIECVFPMTWRATSIEQRGLFEEDVSFFQVAQTTVSWCCWIRGSLCLDVPFDGVRNVRFFKVPNKLWKTSAVSVHFVLEGLHMVTKSVF